MKLSDLANLSLIRGIEVWGECDVTAVTADSRTITPGSCFVAMPSLSRDTTDFFPDVKAAGANSVITCTPAGMKKAKQLGLSGIYIQDAGHTLFAALGRIARAMAGDPTRDMCVIGVTGTNGKSTTAWLMAQALTALGVKTAYLGTIGYWSGEALEEVSNTTPFPSELWEYIARAKRSGHKAIVMEASSHALEQRRLCGVRFDLGIFTNLTPDHLDYHHTMESYAESKRLLFTEYAAASDKPFCSAINVSDPVGKAWAQQMPFPTLTFGEGGELALNPISVTASSIDFDLDGERITVPIGGHFNVENLSAVAAGLKNLGYSVAEISRGLSAVRGTPGRFESVPNNLGIHAIVDYAHTPDALEKVLQSARKLPHNRLIVVFGAGGDRDATKRPIMGGIAARLADLAIITSDNPRTEDPQAIIDQVVGGLRSSEKEYQAILDRPTAIQWAVNAAEPGDILVIAGKGHENYQIIGTTKLHMDDRELLTAALAMRRSVV